jgi:hypothetical protein
MDISAGRRDGTVGEMGRKARLEGSRVAINVDSRPAEGEDMEGSLICNRGHGAYVRQVRPTDIET